ncbi:hypothetical protein ABK733_23635 [Citrobacter freundii]|uniref:hypothetical protein n=2 Tax=Citrobacter freundii TaxID=546 RepID=UPI00101D4901|nr:hypothetical protein [Citrobacter freundii]ECB7637755.1 hypothetical protein [Salmonella enterica subsp. enterica serovar Weltevreden]EHW2078883.1 hypothetical protein [Salmonella enterica subsp. enterica serovar Senftenberg]ECE9755469.1 hypothetical protein [Salmonella enterica subsp. enterica serovar Weltevreden]ELI7002301.1 hypothetical protein [Citrobacter freundii]MBO0957300.1 hypothetical protein [Citrobacter freundii]
MTPASECAAARLINFYINDASRECIEGRRAYLCQCLLPRLKDGLSSMQAWKEKTDDDIELIGIYQKGVDFLTEKLNQVVEQ